LAKNRCKAIGIPWSDAEHEAIVAGVPADYVRNGILSMDAYEKELAKQAVSGKPAKYLSKSEVQKEARSLGIEFSDGTTRPELLELIEVEKEKVKSPASP